MKKWICCNVSMPLLINPHVTNVTNGRFHPYHFDESVFIFKGIGSNCSFLFHSSVSSNGIAPDGTPRFVASYMGLFCLPMSP